ncbi:MAG: hypothetical protein WCK58_14500, partial [Chloroflexota bacterium]
MKQHRLGAVIAAAMMVLTFAGVALAGTVNWSGVNGWPVSVNCSDSAPGEILWIYTGDSDSPVVLTMNGKTYTGEQMGKGAWHIVTPWPGDKPSASVAYSGDYDSGVLTISHGCPAPTPTPTATPY